MQDALQFALSHPLLEAAVAGLVRRVFSRQLTPLRSCTQDPQDSVENRSRVLPRTTSTIGASLRSQDRFNKLPLGIAEFPSSSHASFLTAFLRPENSTIGSTTIYETSSRTAGKVSRGRRMKGRRITAGSLGREKQQDHCCRLRRKSGEVL